MNDDLGGGLLGGVVAPIAGALAVYLWMVWRTARAGPDERMRPLRQRSERRARPAQLARHLAVLAGAGFAVFMAVVFAFSFVFADEAEAIREGLIGGGALALGSAAVYFVVGWVGARIAR